MIKKKKKKKKILSGGIPHRSVSSEYPQTLNIKIILELSQTTLHMFFVRRKEEKNINIFSVEKHIVFFSSLKQTYDNCSEYAHSMLFWSYKKNIFVFMEK